MERLITAVNREDKLHLTTHWTPFQFLCLFFLFTDIVSKLVFRKGVSPSKKTNKIKISQLL